MSKIIDKILNEVSLDERVKDGMFNIEEDSHMEALRDYLSKRGIDEDSVKSFSNRVLEGKYPERQAYNAKGILVTFPTPEYKEEAIKRGTHFEEDPTRQASNIFANPNQPEQQKATPVSEPEEKSKTAPKTNLPASQASSSTVDDNDLAPDPQVQTTAAPQQTPTSDSSTPPSTEPTELPPAPEKSPQEKDADKNAIKKMLKGDDYMLEQVTKFVMYNAPHIMKEINKKLYE